MTPSTTERRDHKRTAFYYSGDGLVDIYTGLIILSFGVLILADLGWMSGVIVAVFLPTWLAAKQSLLSSRLTDVELEQARMQGANNAKVRLFILALVGLMMGLAAFLLLASDTIPASWRLWLSENFSMLAGVFGGIALAFIGAVIKAPRFYGYAVLALVIIGIGAMLGLEFPIAVALLGVAILGVGIVTFVSFLRAHPKIERGQVW